MMTTRMILRVQMLLLLTLTLFRWGVQALFVPCLPRTVAPVKHKSWQTTTTTTQKHSWLLFPFASSHWHGSSRRSSSSSRTALEATPETSTTNNTTDDYSETTTAASNAPTAFATGYSTHSNLTQALQQAVQMALAGLPSNNNKSNNNSTTVVDLCLVSVSSLYNTDTQKVIPTILQTAAAGSVQIQHLIGSSVAGCIGSSSSSSRDASSLPSSSLASWNLPNATEIQPVEYESVPAVTLTFCQLPGCHLQSFYVEDVPEEEEDVSDDEWNRAVPISSVMEDNDNNDNDNDNSPPVFWLVSSPGFSTTHLEDLLYGLQRRFEGCSIAGGVASTVSSLSRAKLYRYSRTTASTTTSTPPSSAAAAASVMTTHTDGCVGVSITGDLQLHSMTAPGAKPVGGVYQILKGQDSTIQVIVLDETATENALVEEEEKDDDDDDDHDDHDDAQNDEASMDASTRAAQRYAKARIPKPVLAEANFLMRTLSDDDQSFMRRQLLIGLETKSPLSSSSPPRTASELVRLASGEGHRFAVQQVASAGMKDGSVTLPLGSVTVTPGMRLRFFVRQADFARQEVEALWVGYKKRLLNQQFGTGDGSAEKLLPPAACFVIPTLDRGQKFFGGKPGLESGAAARMMPGVPSIAGFFSNGVIAHGRVQGSASGYFLWASSRPVYTPAAAAAQELEKAEQQAAQAQRDHMVAAEDAKRLGRTRKGMTDLETKAPRSADGELILKRREVHSGRALTVSTVEWSVAEKTAHPSSALEGFMWDKETEVDRFRERVPLANLVSQCRLSAAEPTAPKPRDFVGPIRDAARDGSFVIVPDCKRTEPVSGSLRRRYDISKLTREFTLAQAPAISVNCDGVLFGGSVEDITKAREASTAAAIEQLSDDNDGVVVPPILANDLVLYPYQLYKLRLAGADAINLVVGALADKDLVYLTKIASSLQLQVLATVTSTVQIQSLLALAAGSIDGVIVSNRQLEDYSFDMTGEQALTLLQSSELAQLKAKHGQDLPVLVEGRVGLIERDGNAMTYATELKQAGALGAIVGGGLAVEGSLTDTLQSLQDA